MNFQEQMDAFLKASRQREIDASDRLQLGEIILKLEAVKNKDLPLVFDIEGEKPMGVCSWRGVYAELCITTREIGAIQTGEMEKYSWGEYSKSEDLGKENPTVGEWIEIMKKCIGGTFEGYKGGDFTMSKNTPVSVCQEQSHSSMRFPNEDFKNCFILDVFEGDDKVVFITGAEEE